MDILNTVAGRSIFFTNSRTPDPVSVSREKLFAYARNWLAVTRVFGLCAPQYLGLVSKYLLTCTDAEVAKAYIEYMQDVAMIAMDDLGLGRGAENGVRGLVHYELFFAQFNDEERVKILSLSIEKETHELCDRIQKGFSTLPGGLATFTVVEAIAERIVETQQNLFGESLYTKLHITLEKEHAVEANDMYKKYKSLSGMETVDVDIMMLVHSFARFWAKMNELTFTQNIKTV